MKQEITRYIKNFKILENDFNLESSNIDGLCEALKTADKWYDGIMENKLYKQAVKTTAKFSGIEYSEDKKLRDYISGDDLAKNLFKFLYKNDFINKENLKITDCEGKKIRDEDCSKIIIDRINQIIKKKEECPVGNSSTSKPVEAKPDAAPAAAPAPVGEQAPPPPPPPPTPPTPPTGKRTSSRTSSSTSP